MKNYYYLVVCLLCSCGKQQAESTLIHLPSNKVSIIVEGETLEFESCYGEGAEHAELMLEATRKMDNGRYAVISLYLEVTDLETYNVGTTTSYGLNSDAYISLYIDDGNPRPQYRSTSGIIRVSEHDKEDKLIEGYFQFNGTNGDEMLQATNGYFHINY